MADILGIGASGLSAYRKLLETVGSNITNANTDGYVRRDVALSGVGESTMLPTAKPNTSGSGVIIESVRRASDYFLQSQALNANALQQQSQVVADSLKQLEKTLFAAGNDPGSVVQEFFNRFSDAANSSTSVPARLAVIDAGQRVARMFNQAASAIDYSMRSLRSGLDVGLQTVNDLAEQLAMTNRDIQRSTSSGQKPNDLLDQRDKLLTKMSDLVGFTFLESENGTVTVYLGDSTSGKPLIGPDGAHQVGVDDSNGRLDIVFDPYTAPMVTSQIKSGTIAGLLDFHQEAERLLMDINRLAVGLSTAVNEVHQQGVDLNGDAGKHLFSADGLVAKAGAANQGSANLTLTINEAAALTGADYRAFYDGAKGNWTITSSQGRSVTGINNITLDGITFSFKGTPLQGDSFTANPLFAAAQNMRFLRQTAPELAFAVPYYVDPAATNKGESTLSVQKSTVTDPAPAITNAVSLFGQNNTPATFKSLGSAFYMAAGMNNASIDSLGSLSAIHFTSNDLVALASSQNQGDARLTITGSDVTSTINRYSARFDSTSQRWSVTSSAGTTVQGDNNIAIDGLTFTFSGSPMSGDSFSASIPQTTLASQLLALNNLRADGEAGGLTISFALDGDTKAPITLHVFPKGDTLSSLAEDVNTALAQAGYASTLFASAKGDTFSLIGLGEHTVSDGRFSGYNRDGVGVDVSATTESRDAASDIRLFTRDGRQLSGPPFASEAEAAAFITVANGFLASAIYVPPSLTSGYPGIDLTQAEDLMAVTTTSANSVKIGVSAYPGLDETQADPSSLSAGAVYALDVAGLPAIRLAGDQITGKNSVGVAEALKEALNAKASHNSWTGSTLNLTGSDLTKVDFTVKIDETNPLTDAIVSSTSYSVTFQRSKDSAGNWLNFGSFDLKGATDLDASVVLDNGTPRIVINAKQALSTNTPVITLSGSNQLALLGLSSSSIQKEVTASGDLTSSLLAARKPTLRVNGQTIGSQTLTITGPNGSQNGIEWRTVDGKLVITSTDETLTVDPQDAVALGLTNATRSGKRLTASEDLATALLADAPVTIDMMTADGRRTVTIDTPQSTTPSHGVSWSLQNGGLSLASSYGSLAVIADTAVLRDDAASLGLFGADLNIAIEGSQLTITSSLASVTNLADSTATVSRVGTHLAIGSALREDVIVALTSDDQSAQRLAFDMPRDPAPTSAAPTFPDVRVRILSSSELEILDANGVSLANRNWTQGEPVNYLGMSFKIRGTASVGDEFTIANDTSRTGDNRNALRLYKLTNESIFGAGQGSFQDVYGAVAAKVGATANSADVTAKSAQKSASDLKAAYDSKTGVDLDREAADLLRFQQAYQASAQVVSAAREMFSTLMRIF
jgi:flagellar hook-associated protein 1 FlgK